MSSFHGVKPGQPPLGVSKPGSRNGGALPDDFSNPSLGLALALLPPGTTPVAAFPPFVKSRHSVKCFKVQGAGCVHSINCVRPALRILGCDISQSGSGSVKECRICR